MWMLQQSSRSPLQRKVSSIKKGIHQLDIAAFPSRCEDNRQNFLFIRQTLSNLGKICSVAKWIVGISFYYQQIQLNVPFRHSFHHTVE